MFNRAKRQEPSIKCVKWIVGLGLFAITFLVFSPTLRFGFVTYDDPMTLIDNPFFRGLGWKNLKWMWTTLYMGPYQPLSWMTLGLDYILWGEDEAGELRPFGYHLTNVVLHSINVLLVFFLALRLLGRPQSVVVPADQGDENNGGKSRETEENEKADQPIGSDWVIGMGDRNADLFGAAAAAFFFGVHPLRVEVVAWITERRELLATTFLLCFLLSYLRYSRCSGREWSRVSFTAYLMSVGFFSLSVFAKALGMTWPVGLLILDIYPLGRLGSSPSKWMENREKRAILWEKVPFIVISLPIMIVAALGQAYAGAMVPWTQHPLEARLTQFGYALIWYLRTELVPVNLCPLYSINPPILPLSARFLPSLIAAGVITSALVWFRRRWPAGLAAWMLFIVLISPVAGLAQSGLQLVADRYSYVPCLPFAVLVGAGFRLLWIWSGNLRTGRGMSIVSRPMLIVLTAALFCVLTGLAVLQMRIWSSSILLWEQVIRISPSPHAELNLGYLYLQAGNLVEAETHLTAAASAPSVFRDISCYHLGNLCREQGRLDDALEYYQRALKLTPGYSDPLCQIGRIHAARGKPAEARKYFDSILQSSPGYADAWIAKGDLAAAEGDHDAALRFYRRAQQVRPDLPGGHERMALELRDAGKLDEAIDQLRRARRCAGKRNSTDDILRKELDELVRPQILENKPRSQ